MSQLFLSAWARWKKRGQRGTTGTRVRGVTKADGDFSFLPILLLTQPCEAGQEGWEGKTSLKQLKEYFVFGGG